MSPLDAMVILILMAGVWLGGVRKYGRSLFDVCALLTAARLTPGISERAQGGLGLDPSSAMALAFLVLAAVFLLIGKAMYDATQWSAGSADRALGALLGVVAGGCVAHVLVLIVVFGGTRTSELPQGINEAPVAREIITFEHFRRLAGTVDRLGA